MDQLRLDLFCKEGLAPEAVDCPVTRGLYDPGTWELRDAIRRPLLQSGGEGLLSKLFSQIEISQKTDEGGHDATPIRAIQCFHDFNSVRGHYLIIKFLGSRTVERGIT